MREMLSNKILNRLDDAAFERLMPLLEPVSLTAGERLAETGEIVQSVYFPENSIISCQVDMQDGKSAGVGMVGKDGVAGLPALFGSRPAVHSLSVAIGGSALRLRKSALEEELKWDDGLQRIIVPYVTDYLTQVAQRAACAILHHIEQRFAVWLLMITDRLDTMSVETTQERMAQYLGVRRAGVTVIARELQSMDAISYTRGSLRIVNRKLLEKVACECYAALAPHPGKLTTDIPADLSAQAAAHRSGPDVLSARTPRRT